MGGQQLCQARLDFFDRWSAGSPAEESLGHLAKHSVGIGDGNASAVGDAQPHDGLFDGHRADFLAPDIDKFFFTTGEEKVPVRRAVSSVPGAEPVAEKGSLVIVR